MSELIISPIDPATDGPRLRRLRQLCGWGERYVDKWLTQHPHDRATYLVCVPQDPEPIGMCAIKLCDDRLGQLYVANRALRIAESGGIYIRPEYRNKGYATRLVQFMDDQARQLGIKTVIMTTLIGMGQSIRIYESMGYKVFMYGSRPYIPEGMYSVYMRKQLDVDLIIRPIDPQQDAPHVLRLRQLCGWDDHYVEASMQQHPHDRVTYLAYVQNDPEPVGMCALSLRDDRYGQMHAANRSLRIAESGSIYIREEYRNKGYARRLVQHIDLEAKRLGIKVITMNAVSDNEQSIRIYASVGYKPYMYAYRAYEPIGLYAIFMRKQLQ